MDTMSTNAGLSLRNAIDQLLQEHRTTAKQTAALKHLRSAYPHSIRPANLADFCELRDEKTSDYDCFTFALDLIDCPERIAAREYAPRKIGPVQRPGIADALPSSIFLQFLQLPKQSSLQSCDDYDLVVYYDKFNNAQHAGKVVADTIISKWGMKGALWQHGLWEIPSSYGTTAHFYCHPTREYVRQQWLNYLDKLAQRVIGFTDLVSVMYECRGTNLDHEELLRLAAQKRMRP